MPVVSLPGDATLLRPQGSEDPGSVSHKWLIRRHHPARLELRRRHLTPPKSPASPQPASTKVSFLFHPQVDLRPARACFQAPWIFTASRRTQHSSRYYSRSQTFNMAQSTHRVRRSFWKPEPEEDPTLHRATTFPPPPQGWVLQTVSAYDLKWSRLYNWLRRTFRDQGGRFEDRQNLQSDMFIFYVPRPLTDVSPTVELSHIDTFRETSRHDDKRQATRDVHTPDP
ncbi:hypothetical protein LZ30DRAFT_252005 [Colletotrichum cereale]|nr:hypothetical protein LZ30DRAFT_252005 [Colletotrichum cereale]